MQTVQLLADRAGFLHCAKRALAPGGPYVARAEGIAAWHMQHDGAGRAAELIERLARHEPLTGSL